MSQGYQPKDYWNFSCKGNPPQDLSGLPELNIKELSSQQIKSLIALRKDAIVETSKELQELLDELNVLELELEERVK